MINITNQSKKRPHPQQKYRGDKSARQVCAKQRMPVHTPSSSSENFSKALWLLLSLHPKSDTPAPVSAPEKGWPSRLPPPATPSQTTAHTITPDLRAAPSAAAGPPKDRAEGPRHSPTRRLGAGHRATFFACRRMAGT